MAEIKTKQELLDKLRSYASTPDDENIRYKNTIKNTLLSCPELLYALHEADLDSELFNSDGTINYDGEWDLFFGETGNIRPYLYIPETQDTIKHYVCYQVSFHEIPRYNDIKKYTQITFTVLVNGKDAMDKMTGIPRHDLISSFIREKINWSNVFGMQAKLVSNKEAISDNNYILRTMIFELLDLNGIVRTPYNGETQIINNDFLGR